MKHHARQNEIGFKDEPFALVGQKLKVPEEPVKERIDNETQDMFKEAKRRPHEARGSSVSNACYGAY